jgi:TatD DNase family protein
MFIDTHCHFDMLEDLEKRIENCRKKNVGIVSTDGVNVETNRRVLELAEDFDEVKVCLGIYPIDALKLSDAEIDAEIEFILSNSSKVFAIGEVGMDFKEDLVDCERQKGTFSKFILLAKELDKPVIVHSRKAEKECIELLEELGAKKVLMHCFSGNFKLIKRIAENGWYLSIPTCVKHSEHFKKMISEVPIEHLLCETDSPYLHPDKKFPNEPANVVASYEKIAETKGLSLKEVEKKIEENFRKLFI